MDKNSKGLRGFLRRIDPFLLIPVLIIIAISLLTLLSINPVFFRQQFISLILGIVLFLLFIRIDLVALRSLSKIFYGIAIALFIMLMLFGVEVGGEKNWFDLFGLRFQVSEMIKPFFIIILSSYLFLDIKQRITKFFGALLISMPIIFLVIRSDFGTGVIYSVITFSLILLAGFPKRYILGSILGAVAIFPLVFLSFEQYQKDRIMTFLDVTSDPTGASYNAIQSLISIGSGGFFGKGFGQGTQSLLRFLPEQHTDFIFATISEDLGFVGSFVVLGLFVVLLYRIYKVSISSRNTYNYLLCMGVFAMLFFQILFNVGMNLGLMPVIGITLPFASYGGNSLIASLIAVGIVSNISTENKRQQSMEIA